MNTNWSRRYTMVCCLVLWLGVGSTALGGRIPGPAQLRLTLDSRGGVFVYLVVFALPPKPAVLEKAMAEALGLKLRDVAWDIDYHKYVVTMYAHSADRLPGSRLSVEGQVQLNGLKRWFNEWQVTAFEVHLTHPRCSFTSCTPGERISPENSSITEYEIRPPLKGDAMPSFQFAFGYRAGDLRQMLVVLGTVLFGFLVGSFIVARTVSGRLSSEETRALARRRFVLAHLFSFWLVWLLAVYLSQADVVSFFLAGAESSLAQTWLSFALNFLPLGLVAGVSAWILDRFSGDGKVGRVRTRIGSLVMRGQLTLLLPTLLWASATVVRRDFDLPKALEWSSAAALATLAAVGLFLWENSVALGMGRRSNPASGGGVEVADVKRRALVRSYYARLGPVVFGPLTVIYFVRELHWDGAIRYGAYGVALVVFVFVLGALVRILPKLARRDEQRLSREPMSGFASSSETGSDSMSGPKSGRWSFLAWLVAVGLLASCACWLLRFSFDLAAGDDGWAMILLTVIAALSEGAFNARTCRDLPAPPGAKPDGVRQV